MYQHANGIFYYFASKNVPIGNITACQTDVANPGQRKNTDPSGEERYTFVLSTTPNGDGNAILNVKSVQAHSPSLT